MSQNERLIFPVGTQVVTQKEVRASNNLLIHPAGAVGTVIRSPVDRQHAYRILFADGHESALHHDQLIPLRQFHSTPAREVASQVDRSSDSDAQDSVLNGEIMTGGLNERVIYRCVIGSRAYGLDDTSSDTDRRGVYLPCADDHWSLYGVPEQIECEETQEAYWELQKFIGLALKANPNVLECLYSPIVETSTQLAEELISMRQCFLSKLIFQTYSGYVASQFKKMQTDIRNQGRVKPKHVMHLIRLLISGTQVLRDETLNLDVGPHRESLLSIKRGQMSFSDADAWRKDLQRQFETAFSQTQLPERPDYEKANAFLIRARKMATQESLP